MTLWTRWGILIPILWLMGFVVIGSADHFAHDAVPDEWMVTFGHLVGTFFVWIFSISLGATTVKEVIDVETEQSTVIEMPHKFLFFSANMWGFILTIAAVWFFFDPPSKVWWDKALLQKIALQKKIEQVSEQAMEKLRGKKVEGKASSQ